jgi:NADPH-dependent ferric siderophore reductase
MDVIHTLAEVDAPWCRQVLREALVPKAARPLPPEAIATSSGQQSFLPRKVEIPDGCSVPAGAALALLFLRDEASLPVIKAMVDTLPEPDRGVVAGRLTEFQRQPPAP